MKSLSQDSSQAMQRIRVGMTGLASVLVLIGLASAVFRSASNEPPVAVVGASKPEVVANLTDSDLDNGSSNEPLADLGVAPSAKGQPTPPAK
jgi:hypothetical protein